MLLTKLQLEVLAKRADWLKSFDRIDDNPTDIGLGLWACGPTTGEWLSAHDFHFVDRVSVNGIVFTIAR